MPSVFANGNTKPSALSFAGQAAPSLAKKQTHHRVKIRLMAMHHIQQGHTYANTAKTYLVNINGQQI
jgi:hypothetical protein